MDGKMPVEFADDVDQKALDASPALKDVIPRPEKKLPVMEIFGPTVQGEGLVIGQRTLFIRFGLCDYKCKMCDSLHAVDPKYVSEHARWITTSEIFGEVLGMCSKHNCGWVTLSGGNPAMHNLHDLVLSLHDAHIGVSVETQGTFAPHWLGNCDYVTVSPKAPGMGEKFEPEKYVNFIREFRGHPGLSCKIVIFSAQDLEFASMVAEMTPLLVNTDRFYLSLGNPYPPDLEGHTYAGLSTSDIRQDSLRRYEELVEDLKEYPALRTVRVLPQLHHLMWGNEKGR
jgi:7-carboxy-7-deazaguanine synthase